MTAHDRRKLAYPPHWDDEPEESEPDYDADHDARADREIEDAQ